MPSAPPLSGAATAVRKSVFAELQTRIDAYRSAGGQLIPLQIGDSYLTPPAAAHEAAAQDADPGGASLSQYGPVPGVPELRSEIARFRLERGFPCDIGAEHVHVGCGCTHALFCAARAVLDPGDEVLVCCPYWPLIVGVLQTAAAVPVEVPCGSDWEAMLESVRTDRTRAVYIVTPNNPDGRVLSQGDLAQIAAYARRHDLWVFADEVYADFVYEGEHRSIAGLEGMWERTISSFSLSKSHALAGARIGYVIAPTRVVDATRRMSNHTVYNVPVPMQRAALAALGDRAWVDDAREVYRQARDRACAALSELGLDFVEPAGGSFVFVDLSGELEERSVRQLLESAIDEGVLLAPGAAFGAAFADHVRICFTGVPVDQVLEGIARFGRAVRRA